MIRQTSIDRLLKYATLHKFIFVNKQIYYKVLGGSHETQRSIMPKPKKHLTNRLFRWMCGMLRRLV